MTNVRGTAVVIHPADLPDTWKARYAELKRLSQILHVPVKEMLRGIKLREGDPVTPVVVREDVKRTAPISYLAEHQDEFPGVDITDTFIRYYPQGDLAAQLLGYVNEISPEQLKRLKTRATPGATRSASRGWRRRTTRTSAAAPGLAQLRVDSLGRPRSQLQTKRPAAPGESIKLTIDSGLQRAAEDAHRATGSTRRC